ncbi:hypothetical protein D3C86_2194620 [compost metagenome]
MGRLIASQTLRPNTPASSSLISEKRRKNEVGSLNAVSLRRKKRSMNQSRRSVSSASI